MRRSMLFIPGNTPNLLINSNCLGSDAIIFDLEDAVAPGEKDSARLLVRNTIKYMDFTGIEIIVRINALDSGFWKEDLEEIIPVKPDIIMLPKTNHADDVLLVSEYIKQMELRLGIENNTFKIMPLIETALGVENSYQIASSDKRVCAIFLGAEDLTADMRCKRTKVGKEIDYARSRLVIAARASGIDVYDTPFTDVNDDDGVKIDAEYAKSLGFTGKASISPRHVELINRVFSPSIDDIRYAYEVMDAIEEAQAIGRGAIALRGKMIDAPIVARARQTIEMAESMGIRKEQIDG
ncbi:MAG: CoA ester lyase [Eubacterium sp.]|nr:CoA ester lyase [Eubacterium sp.]